MNFMSLKRGLLESLNTPLNNSAISLAVKRKVLNPVSTGDELLSLVRYLIIDYRFIHLFD